MIKGLCPILDGAQVVGRVLVRGCNRIERTAFSVVQYFLNYVND